MSTVRRALPLAVRLAIWFWVAVAVVVFAAALAHPASFGLNGRASPSTATPAVEALTSSDGRHVRAITLTDARGIRRATCFLDGDAPTQTPLGCVDH